MTESHNARFSLRLVLLGLTVVVIALGVTAPLVRQMPEVRRQGILTGMMGMLIGFAAGGTLFWWRRARALRHAGSLLCQLPVAFNWQFALLTVNCMFLGLIQVGLFWLPDAPLPWFPILFVGCFVAIVGASIAYAYCGSKTIELREFGTIHYAAFRTWDEVLDYGWYDASTLFLTFAWSRWPTRYEYYRVKPGHRPSVEAILADKVKLPTS